MPQQQSPMVLQQPKQKSGGGGILRSILRPFMPEVAAGIDAADGVLTALRGGDGSDGFAQAAKMLKSEMDGEGGEEEKPGTVEVPPNPTLSGGPTGGMGGAMGGGAGGGGGGSPEEEDENEGEPDEDEDDFNPAEWDSVNKIASLLPGVGSELESDPGLLDGVMNLAMKLKKHYGRSAPEGMA